MKAEHGIQIICATPGLAREYVSEFHRAAEPFHLRPIARLAEARLLSAGVSVFLLDQSGQSKQGLKSAVDRLVEVAPVIVVAAPERQSELTALLTSGVVDFVARTGKFVPVAVGLVERRIRAKTGILDPSGRVSCDWSADFGEILRHEVNNPLTGILGNAEMLLARRDRLPASAIERLETIAHLAVRLRETVRRLSSAIGSSDLITEALVFDSFKYGQIRKSTSSR
jgi:signal transduction histidine kinase